MSPASLDAVGAQGTGNARQARATIEAAARELEAVLWQHVLSALRRSLPGRGWLGQSYAARMYAEMMDEQLARTVAEAGGLGLAELLAEQLEQDLGRVDKSGPPRVR